MKLKILYCISLLFICVTTWAQTAFNGVVTDASTGEPIVGAIITIDGGKQAVAVSDLSGRFSLKQTPQQTVTISYIGYKKLTARAVNGATYKLQSDTKALNEVTVTAQESRSLASASLIGKHAMEHLQPSSFSDILELLPGGRSSDPSLSTPNNIRLREAGGGGSNYATSSLGTSFIIDGSPMSTNGNMLYLSGAWDVASTYRDNVNSGVDMRSIATDDIEKVEVVRGVASVEYGDLTSGLIKIERRKGGRDLQARLKADMSSKLFYLAKAFEWQPQRLSLNLSIDYLNAKADPRNRLENYKRLTLSSRLNKQWISERYEKTLSINADYTGSFDNDKIDPDLNNQAEDSYKSSYDRFAANANFQIKTKQRSWLKSLGAMFSTSYSHDLIKRTRLVQLQRLTVAATTRQEGESDAVILPYKYTAWHNVDGKPLNLFARLNARLQVPSNTVSNTLLLGTDWNMDKNYGKGQLFDPEKPLYTDMSARQRRLSEIPANHTWGLYAEETVKVPLWGGAFEMMAGVRGSEMLNLPADYEMHGKMYFDPRANVGWTFPRFKLFGLPAYIRLAGGWGMHTKNPTMEQLFPDKVYMDLIQLNYYHDNPAYRRINIMTYVRDPRNIELHPARNRKWEVTGDINVGGNRLSVTLFRENMTSGFRSQTRYESYTYKQYDGSTIDASQLTDKPDLSTLSYEMMQDLRGYGIYTNGSQTLKQGVEYTFETRRFPVINTRLTINGAYFKTTYRNSLVETYRPSQVVAGRQIQYVGYYEDDGGTISQRMNTNFTVDTDIPKLKLGFSISSQWLWFTMSQRREESRYPVKYQSPDGEMHDWDMSMADDIYLRWLVRSYNSSLYQKSRIPLSMNLNFKVTKKLMGDKLNIAMFCNKIWDYTPSYKSGNATIRRHVTAYFGLETNVKL